MHLGLPTFESTFEIPSHFIPETKNPTTNLPPSLSPLQPSVIQQHRETQRFKARH